VSPSAHSIDLNADLGEGFGPWTIGDDAGLLGIVTSANVACGGHAGDPDIMLATLMQAKALGVAVGAHPGFADPAGFGRRIIPMSLRSVEAMVATQLGSLMGAAALAGVRIGHLKAHGALANLAAVDSDVAGAVARAVAAVSRDLVMLVISGSAQGPAAQACGLATCDEVFADRAYLPDGRLVPRDRPGAVLTDPGQAALRLLAFVQTGLMATLGGPPVRLSAGSVCVHGDAPGAVAFAGKMRAALTGAGVTLTAFALPPARLVP